MTRSVCPMGHVPPVEAAEPVVRTARQASSEAYLRSLAYACLEAAGNPQVRPLLYALLMRAPGTLRALCRARVTA